MNFSWENLLTLPKTWSYFKSNFVQIRELRRLMKLYFKKKKGSVFQSHKWHTISCSLQFFTKATLKSFLFCCCEGIENEEKLSALSCCCYSYFACYTGYRSRHDSKDLNIESHSHSRFNTMRYFLVCPLNQASNDIDENLFFRCDRQSKPFFFFILLHIHSNTQQLEHWKHVFYALWSSYQ